MNSKKPLEPGCMAMIINAPPHKIEWSGTPVIVLERVQQTHCLPDGTGNGRPGWMINIPNPRAQSGYWALQDRYLMRIDDPGTQKEIELEHKLIKPKRGKTHATS